MGIIFTIFAKHSGGDVSLLLFFNKMSVARQRRIPWFHYHHVLILHAIQPPQIREDDR